VTAVVLLLSLQHPPHSTAAQVLHHTLLPSISSPSSSVELTESRQMTPCSLPCFICDRGRAIDHHPYAKSSLLAQHGQAAAKCSD
jgi:hypothetical protein